MTSPRVWFDQFVVATNKCFTVGNDSFSAGVFSCVGLMEINWGKIKSLRLSALQIYSNSMRLRLLLFLFMAKSLKKALSHIIVQPTQCLS